MIQRTLSGEWSDLTKATQMASGYVRAKPRSDPTPSLISTKNKHWMDDNAFLRATYACSEFTRPGI